MAVKSFDTSEQFAIVATGDQDLDMLSDGGLQ
jgi:hypothetical protein